MSIKSKILKLSEDLEDLIALSHRSDEESIMLKNLMRDFSTCISEYSPTRRNLARAFNYLIPHHDKDTLTQLLQLLKNCENLPNEWISVVNEFDNNPVNVNASFLSNTKLDKEKNEDDKFEKLSNNIKPNRKMAVSKLGCSLEEWLDFLESFNEDSALIGLSEEEKVKVFWRQLAENSEERIFYKYTLDQNEAYDFNSIIKNITNLKIGSDDDEYWEEALDKLPNQSPNESVASFTARYIRLKKFYEKFVGVEPPLNRYRRKLRKDISDLLIGTVCVNNFDELMKRALKIEKDLKSALPLCKDKQTIGNHLLPLRPVCQICSKSGHVAKDCFQFVPCKNCGNRGHNSRNCRIKRTYKKDEIDRSQEDNKKQSHVLGFGNNENSEIIVEECFKVKESMENVKVFGCHAEYWVPSEKREKLEEKTKTAIYLGTNDSCNVNELNMTRLYDLKEMKIAYARDVKFYEDRFPYKIAVVAGLNFEYHDISQSNEKKLNEAKHFSIKNTC
jgi:hypothetical protein